MQLFIGIFPVVRTEMQLVDNIACKNNIFSHLVVIKIFSSPLKKTSLILSGNKSLLTLYSYLQQKSKKCHQESSKVSTTDKEHIYREGTDKRTPR